MKKDSKLPSRVKNLTLPVVLLAGMALLGLIAPATQGQIGGAGLQITTSQTLFPQFDPDITDYVVPAGSNGSLQFTVSAPRNVKVSVDGQPFRKLNFTTTVNNLDPGERFSFTVNSIAGSKTYNVRRLPADFPLWTTDRSGTPQAEFYVFVPNLFNAPQNYIVIADNWGVPLWWYRVTTYQPIDAKLLPNGNIGWLAFGGPQTAEERTLNGSLVRTLAPVAAELDQHELLLLPNGNYLIIANVFTPTDLSPFGGPANGSIIDHVIQELTPTGILVWNWKASDHIAIAETTPPWRTQFLVNASPADPFHFNSVEPDGDGYVISARHDEAIYRIDRASGAITWKLGGIARPESLTFVGDPFSNFGGQHDARILEDGTLTLHDNGSQRGRAARAVRYDLDLTARTATLLENVSDTLAAGSICCGSARKLPTGNWVTEWGSRPYVTELTEAGQVVLRLRLQDPAFSYRVAPVMPGELSREALRSGMDTQFPR